MAWLQSESKLRSHPKLQITATELGITKVEMIGHLHLFWYWILEYHEDGNLKTYGNSIEDKRKFLAEAVSEGAEWTGDPIKFFDTLVKYAWIDEKDEQFSVHDWNDLSGKYAIQKEQTRQRAKKFRDKKKNGDFYNPKQMDMEAEVWDQPTKVIEPVKTDAKEATLSQAIFSVLTQTIRGSYKDMTDNERARYNAATQQLVQINANPDDIPIRYSHYIQSYGRKPTPHALVTHWGDLADKPINLSSKEREKLTTLKLEEMKNQDLQQWATEE